MTLADVKIVSDGTRSGTHVFAVDPHSGMELELRVAFISWMLDADAGSMQADVVLMHPIVEVEANGVTLPPPDTELEGIEGIDERLT